MPTLTGELDQIPPAYSAKRVGGRRAYDLAREGATVTLAPARVRVDAWEVLGWRGGGDAVAELDVRITCGGGTYVRSLARDLARAAGSEAHLASLRRLRSGAFDVADADSLDALREGGARVRPALAALPHLPIQPLGTADVRRVTSGIAVDAAVDGAWAALTSDPSGALVALAERVGERWQPRVVLREG
jgi:tRNA pseudouridine55 synthase